MTFTIALGSTKPTITHDPEAELDYQWDLSNLIDSSDLIVDASFAAFIGDPTGDVATGITITLGSIAVDGKSVWGWLSVTDVPSTLNQTIAVTCHFTTANERVDDRTLYFKIKNR